MQVSQGPGQEYPIPEKAPLFSVPPHGRSRVTGADPTRTAGLNNNRYEHWREILNT